MVSVRFTAANFDACVYFVLYPAQTIVSKTHAHKIYTNVQALREKSYMRFKL